MKGRKALMSSARTGESERDEWRTPPALFEALQRGLGLRFDADAFSRLDNSLCGMFGRIGNGMTDWALVGATSHDLRAVFANPPYSAMKNAAHAIAHNARKLAVVASLVPARTNTAWWQTLTAECACVAFIRGRVRFLLPSGEASASAPFPSAVVVHARGHTFNLRELGDALNASVWVPTV